MSFSMPGNESNSTPVSLSIFLPFSPNTANLAFSSNPRFMAAPTTSAFTSPRKPSSEHIIKYPLGMPFCSIKNGLVSEIALRRPKHSIILSFNISLLGFLDERLPNSEVAISFKTSIVSVRSRLYERSFFICATGIITFSPL